MPEEKITREGQTYIAEAPAPVHEYLLRKLKELRNHMHDDLGIDHYEIACILGHFVGGYVAHHDDTIRRNYVEGGQYRENILRLYGLIAKTDGKSIEKSITDGVLEDAFMINFKEEHAAHLKSHVDYLANKGANQPDIQSMLEEMFGMKKDTPKKDLN